MYDVKALRQAIASLPAPSHESGAPPRPEDVYAPTSHENALDPSRTLVVGGRGTGKSFWSGSLVSDAVRAYVARIFPRIRLADFSASLGFGDEYSKTAPSREVFDQLEDEGFAPEKIWRAVVLRCIIPKSGRWQNLPVTLGGPDGLVAWLQSDAERAQTLFRECDEALFDANDKQLVIFDALDRVGRDWKSIRTRTQNLLRVASSLNSYRCIKVKIFMRTDQLEDRSVTAFPDASKLVSNRVDLNWEQTDLFGLLFHTLANFQATKDEFRRLVRDSASIVLPEETPSQLPDELRRTAKHQEEIFIALAGRYMGSNARKGRTYNWLYNHLADAHHTVSPRSFLESIRSAADSSDTSDLRSPIHYRGLHAGLQSASQVRLLQLNEEYGWIENALGALAELRVPCDSAEVYRRWRDSGTVSDIRASAGQQGYLEPIEFSSQDEMNDQQTLEALLMALRRIGIAELRPDGRINVPDIYRIAARLIKKGGVPPAR